MREGRMSTCVLFDFIVPRVSKDRRVFQTGKDLYTGPCIATFQSAYFNGFP